MTLFSYKRRNSIWLRSFFRRIELCKFYHSLGRGWRESWSMAERTI